MGLLVDIKGTDGFVLLLSAGTTALSLRLESGKPSKVAQAETLLTCIRGVLTSNLGRHTDYPDGFACLPQLLHANI